jgi:uncharacterized membrane protein YphA (DoxX/SURF4 family)
MYITEPVLESTDGAHGRGRWPPLGRVAFRVMFVYAVIYLLPQWLFLLPGLRVAGSWYSNADRWIDLRVGRFLLGVDAPIDLHTLGTGSGDTMLDYLTLSWQAAAACFAALIWTLVDRGRVEYDRLHQWLRVYVRYALAAIMFGYGFAKVFFPGQFAHPTLDRLIEPIGHSSPMGLLWTFMGYSQPYTVFTGAVECLGGLLLLSQRTTTLGALVVAAAMGNVAMLNFSYDVPVKLYSSHLFLFALLLLAPEASRLVRVFVTNRSVDAAKVREPFASTWSRRAAFAAKWTIIAVMTWQNVWPRVTTLRQPPRQPVNDYGIYEVESFAANGEARPATPMDARRWRRVIINETGGLSVQTMDDATIRYRTKKDPKNHTYELSTIFSPYDKTVLTYGEPAPDRLVLDGRYAGETIAVTLRKTSLPRFLLNERGFHWVSEYPYNR